MADNLGNNNQEPLRPTLEIQSKRENEKREAKLSQQEVSKTADQFVEGVAEVVESAEFTKEITESFGEDKKKGPAGKIAGGAAAQTTTTTAFQPIKVPRIEVMRIQVAKEIKKQIRVLEHQAQKIMQSPGTFSPFTLNGVVAKIRELREILAQLAYATLETVKGWWMKFVKNISI